MFPLQLLLGIHNNLHHHNSNLHCCLHRHKVHLYKVPVFHILKLCLKLQKKYTFIVKSQPNALCFEAYLKKSHFSYSLIHVQLVQKSVLVSDPQQSPASHKSVPFSGSGPIIPWKTHFSLLFISSQNPSPTHSLCPP